MTGIDRCSRCHEPFGEGIRRAYYPEDPMPNMMLCKKCMDSFFEWEEVMRSKEAKE